MSGAGGGCEHPMGAWHRGDAWEGGVEPHAPHYCCPDACSSSRRSCKSSVL